MKNYSIPENLVNGLLNYLASRPLGETLEMFAALRSLQPVAEPAPKAPEPSDDKPAEKAPAPVTPIKDAKKKA